MKGLFTKEFYSSVSKALKADGIMACQSESPWYPKEVLQRIYNNVSGGFRFIMPYVGSVPTYPTGTWSWTLASNDLLLPEAMIRQDSNQSMIKAYRIYLRG